MRFSSIRSRLLFPLIIFLIITGFYWKLTLTRQFDWVWGPDLAQQVLPWFEEEARQLQHSELPLWDPHTWNGQPMLGQAQPGTAYPINWLLFLMPRSHGHMSRGVLQWYFIAIRFMAALFCYLLCRDLGRSRPGSLLAGLVFSLASYIGTTDWPQMVNGAVWAPLVFLFLLRAVRGYRPLVSAALSGAFMGTAWLAGHHQVPIYITLAMSGTWLYFALRRGRIDWNIAKLAAVCLIFMFLVGALQILPAQEYGKLAKRWAGADHELRWDEPVPYYVHKMYATNPMGLLGILVPGFAPHSDPFIGVVAFSLALLAIGLAWKEPSVPLFAAVAIGGIVYTLGPNSIFHGLIYSVVPMVEKARVASMAGVIWGFGTAVLVSFGADYFGAESHSLWARRMVLGILGFGLISFFLLLGAMFATKMSWGSDDRVVLTVLIAIVLAALLYAWRTGNLTPNTALVLLTMLMLFELGNDSGYTFPDRHDKERESYLEKITSNTDIADYLHQKPGPFRVEVETEALSANWSNYNNFDMIKALCASVTINVMNTEFFTWQNRLLFGVRYTISEKRPLNDSQDVFTGASGLKVWENPGAFPRAWAVHEVFKIKEPGEGRVFINDHLGDLRSKAFTESDPVKLQPCSGADQVAVSKYAAESLNITADMACEGMVVLSDTWFPGWKATVDGKPAGIQEVNLAMRGVVVPQGHHQIAMRYRPASVYVGAALTALGWLGAIALIFFGPIGHLTYAPNTGTMQSRNVF